MAEKADISTRKGDLLDNWIDGLIRFLSKLRNDRTSASLQVFNTYIPKATNLFQFAGNPDTFVDDAVKKIGGGSARLNKLFPNLNSVDRMLVLLQAFSRLLVETANPSSNAVADNNLYLELLGAGAGKDILTKAKKIGSLGESVRMLQRELSDLKDDVNRKLPSRIDDFVSALSKGDEKKIQKSKQELGGILAFFFGSDVVNSSLGLRLPNIYGLLDLGEMQARNLGARKAASADKPDSLNDFHYSLFHYSHLTFNECGELLSSIKENLAKNNSGDVKSLLFKVKETLSDRILPRRG